jgi:hypothetical protein
MATFMRVRLDATRKSKSMAANNKKVLPQLHRVAIKKSGILPPPKGRKC